MGLCASVEDELHLAEGGWRVRFHPGHGRIFALATAVDQERGQAFICDTATGAVIKQIETGGKRPWEIRFSPDGATLAVAMADATVRLIDVASGEQRAKLVGHQAAVGALSFSADGTQLLSGADDKTLIIWSVAQREAAQYLRGHGNVLMSAVFSPDGRRVVSGAAERALRVWNPANGACIKTLAGHGSRVQTIVMANNGAFFLSAGDDGIVHKWNIDEKGLDGVGASVALKFNHDNVVRVAVNAEEKDVNEGKSKSIVLDLHQDSVLQLAVSADSKMLFSSSCDASVRFIDLDTQSTRTTLRAPNGHAAPVNSVDISPDGTEILTASDDNTVRRFLIATGETVANVKLPGAWRARWTPDGTRFALARCVDQQRGELVLCEAAHGQILRTFETKFSRPWEVRFSPNGQLVAGALADATIRIWETDTGREVARLVGHLAAIGALNFSPDGKLLVSGADDCAVFIWSIAEQRPLHVLRGHKGVLMCAAFSPDGRIVATGSADCVLRLWDVATGREIRRLYGHTETVETLCFLPNGSQLISGGRDHKIRLWPLAENGIDASPPPAYAAAVSGVTSTVLGGAPLN